MGGRIPVVSPYPRSMNTATDNVITIGVGEQIIQSFNSGIYTSTLFF